MNTFVYKILMIDRLDQSWRNTSEENSSYAQIYICIKIRIKITYRKLKRIEKMSKTFSAFAFGPSIICIGTINI